MDRNSSAIEAPPSHIGTDVKITEVRISACVESGESQRHFEVQAPTFDEAYAELVRRLMRAGYDMGTVRAGHRTSTRGDA